MRRLGPARVLHQPSERGENAHSACKGRREEKQLCSIHSTTKCWVGPTAPPNQPRCHSRRWSILYRLVSATATSAAGAHTVEMERPPSEATYRLYLSSLASAARNSSSARLPAYSAAAWDRNPLRPTIVPIGLLWRLSSQRHEWGRSPVSKVAM